ncbi:MAG TPA: DMT family transporter [Streptosporangiaceae bacterium]|jgi:drug/metabolite transporter (DMT)-like permease|nr:DMT family transporter [Streptosporangiaceae bacterium]
MGWPSVLAILLALGAALGYGGSDFAAGLATRRASVIRVTLLSAVVNVAVVGVALAVIGANSPGPRAVIWGVVAGLAGELGALTLYLGFRHAAFSVAGPLSAVAAAAFSVLAGLLLGERPTALDLTGIALALPAIVGVSVSVSPPAAPSQVAPVAGRPAVARVPAGVFYGLVAGAGFGLLFIGLNQAGDASGLWPVFSGQAAALAAMVVIAAMTRDLRLPERRSAWLAALTGATGGPATIAYFLATQRGLLAIAAVITSLYPAITIVLARVLLGERLTVIRLAGLSLAAASVALIAVGGAG